MLRLFDSLFDTALGWTLRMDATEWTIAAVAIVAIGWVCMRGFGSRAGY
jgi:hypothetical protein